MENEFKTSKAQREANKRYKEKNKEKLKIQTYFSNAKLFISEHADVESLEELEKLIDERKKDLKSVK